MEKYRLSPEQVEKIKIAAEKCDRIELVPTKEGQFKIAVINRKNLEKINK